MSAFEARVNVAATSIAIPTEEQQEQGANNVDIHLVVTVPLPFAQGPGQPPLQTQLGTIVYGLDRDTAIKFFKQGLEAAEKLPKTSDLEVATDLSAAEAAAQRLEALKAGKA